ncbi:MAG TPA: alcohol dehydrogenase catalytic domain-containing protein [Chloroflexota bacterium]|nr:alcohol dehydrogenase catalytic domain-containing protein [Chloroflexota bacterium]
MRVEVCGCCRTYLQVVEGELPQLKLPVIPGHQVVDMVESQGRDVTRFREGDRLCIAWLRHVDGTYHYCRTGAENLYRAAAFTGYWPTVVTPKCTVISENFAYHIPAEVTAIQAAPLLCAGIIGYRALKRSELKPGSRLGMFGFGSSAHVTMNYLILRGPQPGVPGAGADGRVLDGVDPEAVFVRRGQAREPKCLTQRLLHVAARLVRTGRRTILRLQRDWPGSHELAQAFTRLRALPAAP